jgi:hypothetical protein
MSSGSSTNRFRSERLIRFRFSSTSLTRTRITSPGFTTECTSVTRVSAISLMCNNPSCLICARARPALGSQRRIHPCLDPACEENW